MSLMTSACYQRTLFMTKGTMLSLNYIEWNGLHATELTEEL